MDFRRIKNKWFGRKRNWLLLAVSLLLAVFMRETYNLSQYHPVSVQCRILLQTDLEGYEGEALSEEILLVDGQAKGFDVRRFRTTASRPLEIPVRARPELLTAHPERAGAFVLSSKEVAGELAQHFGSDLLVSYVEETGLTFSFLRQSYKKVPVEVRSALTFAPQYMAAGPVTVTPDSVSLYGRERDLASVRQVVTRPVTLNGIDHTTRGQVRLVPVPGFRLGTDRVEYLVEAVRYVEMSFETRVIPLHVPMNREMAILPSKVKVICKVPYGTRSEELSSLTFTVDYRELSRSRTSQMIPRPGRSQVPILSCRLEPRMVECFVKQL